MRYIITQKYTNDHKEMFDLVSPINQAYAEKAGFEYIANGETLCPTRQIWWEKIAWLIKLLSTLEEGAMVVYEDCDAINISGDLKTALHSGFEYGMVQLRGGAGGEQLLKWYNAGVIIMINTPDVREFLQRVWDRADDTDESSINKEIKSLNNTIGNSKPMCSLYTDWNCWSNNERLTKNVCIKSWHGMTYASKLQSIKDYISKK